MVELSGTVFLLRNTAKPQCKSINFLKGNDSREGRNWVVGSALGLGCLLGFVFITSLVADELFGSKVSPYAWTDLYHSLLRSYLHLPSFNIAEAVCVWSLALSQGVHSSELEKIMANGDLSRSGCFALYCVVAPILEEIVYRRFLLTSLASKMEWRKALVISSGVFAAAHFSGEDLVQLFGIGCVLGACYSWSGNLASSVVVHSLYNALTLLVTLLS